MTAQFVCETCTYPSLAPDRCDNPACLANPTLPQAHRDRLVAAEAKRLLHNLINEERLRQRKRLRKSGFRVF